MNNCLFLFQTLSSVKCFVVSCEQDENALKEQIGTTKNPVTDVWHVNYGVIPVSRAFWRATSPAYLTPLGKTVTTGQQGVTKPGVVAQIREKATTITYYVEIGKGQNVNKRLVVGQRTLTLENIASLFEAGSPIKVWKVEYGVFPLRTKLTSLGDVVKGV